MSTACAIQAATLRRLRDATPGGWIVVEKILAAGELLPASWPVDGTTGYDFMEQVAALFVDPDGEPALTETFTAYTGQPFDPAGESRRARLEVMTDALHSELARLTELAVRACALSPACRDYTRAEIETVLPELLAGYPVYRTYLGGDDPAHAADRARIAEAVRAARLARPELDVDLVSFLEAALAFELPTAEAAAGRLARRAVRRGDRGRRAADVGVVARVADRVAMAHLRRTTWVCAAAHGRLCCARIRGLTA